MNIVKLEELTNKLLSIDGEFVLLDKDVADLYDVKPRRLKEQLKRNIEKFPDDYAFQLSEEQTDSLVSQNAIPSKKSLGGHLPYVFTEKGLYMAATVLKSPKATEATFTIIETFAKIRELSRNINTIDTITSEEERSEIVKKTGQILEDIIDIEPFSEESDTEIIETEMRIELNFCFVKASRTTKKKKG